MLDALRSCFSPLGGAVPVSVLRRSEPFPGRAALLRLANDRLRRRPRSYRRAFTDAGIVVDGSTADMIERYLYVFGSWEPPLGAFLRSRLRAGDVFLDVGANVGYFTLLAGRAVGPEGRVYAFEANPRTVEKLRRNIEANALDNVDVLPVAASDVSGQVEIYSGPQTNVGRSSTAPIQDGAYIGRVECVVAADAVPRELWSRIRAIKVDVEGDELSVLRGLRHVLDALPSGASVIVEVGPDRLRERGHDASEVIALLEASEFELATLRNDYHPRTYARPVYVSPAPLTETPAQVVDLVGTKR